MNAFVDFRRNPLARVIWSLRREFAVVGLLSMIANLLMLSPTLYMLQIYDRVMISQSQLTLLMLSLIIILFVAVLAFAEWIRSRLLVRAGVRFDEALNGRIFRAGFRAERAGRLPPGVHLFLDALGIVDLA